MLDLRSAVAHGQALLAQGEHRDPQTWCRSGLGAGTWYRWLHARMLDLSARLAVDEGETSGLAAELERERRDRSCSDGRHVDAALAGC